MPTLLPGKINKYKYLAGEEIIPSDQTIVIVQANFTYLTPGKALKKQTKTIEEQKQLVAFDDFDNGKDDSDVEGRDYEKVLFNLKSSINFTIKDKKIK